MRFLIKFVAVLYMAFSLPALAANPPESIKEFFKIKYPKGSFRMDGVFKNGSNLFLPVLPNEASESKNVELLYSANGDFLFSNDWIYTKIKDNTLKSFQFFDKEVQSQILSNKITEDFVIPRGFSLPRDLAVIGGRLPFKFRNVELATEREERYLELLKQEIKDSTLEVLSYDILSGDFQLNKLLFKPKSKTKARADVADLEIIEKADLAKNFSLLSQVKLIGSKAYLVDYNKATVFELEMKPDEDFEIKEFLSVDKELGLQDFITSVDGSVSYLLTNKNPQLFIFDTKSKELIKVIKLPANPSSLFSYSRNSQDSDYVIVTCKGDDKVAFISSFDHRIVKQVKVGALPISMVADKDFLYVANKGNSSISVIDWVTRKVVNAIKLPEKPSKMLMSKDSKQIYVLNSQAASISVVEVEEALVSQTIELGPDLVEPKDMAFSPESYFLIVGSSKSDTIGLVDIETLKLVKKFDIESLSTKLLVKN